MMYTITSRVSNRPNGTYRYVTEIPTFFLDDRVQGIIHVEHAAMIARNMIATLVRQDLSAGARIHVEATNDDGSVYAVAEVG